MLRRSIFDQPCHCAATGLFKPVRFKNVTCTLQWNAGTRKSPPTSYAYNVKNLCYLLVFRVAFFVSDCLAKIRTIISVQIQNYAHHSGQAFAEFRRFHQYLDFFSNFIDGAARRAQTLWNEFLVPRPVFIIFEFITRISADWTMNEWKSWHTIKIPFARIWQCTK